MNYPRLSLTAILLLLIGWLPAVAGEPAFAELLQQLLPRLGSASFAERNDAQQKLQNACFALGAPGAEARRARAATLMAQRLGPETPQPARICLLKQLDLIGGAQCVDAVAALLKDDDADLREQARRTLQSNPSPQANARLLEALQSAGPAPWRTAIINSLGVRGQQESIDKLAQLLADTDAALAQAAAAALGKIGGERAAKALADAAPNASPRMHAPIAAARLRCADKLLDDGKTTAAADLYRQMAKPRNPKLIRRAALQGMLHSSGERVAETIVEMLAGDDPDVRAVAAGHIRNVRGPRATETFAAALAGLPPTGRMLLLEALAARRDRSALPVAVAAARSEHLPTRLVGLRCLATLADASVVPLLIETMASGGEAGDVARQSLVSAFGAGVDQAIMAAAEEADVPLRVDLIDVLAQRLATAAVPMLLRDARHEDAAIRQRAIETLGKLAEPKNIPQLIELLLDSERGLQRDRIEKVIMTVANRIAEEAQRSAPVLRALSAADDSQRPLLLPALGRIGGGKALAAICSALESDRPPIREAAVRGLCNWPNASVAGQLLEIAKTSENRSHRIWALRAHIRVITLPSDRGAAETLALLKEAMKRAARVDEKKLIIDRAAVVRSVDTLRWIVPYLDHQPLSRAACRTVVALAHHKDLMRPNQAEFMAALQKVVRASSDQALIDQATRYMQGL